MKQYLTVCNIMEKNLFTLLLHSLFIILYLVFFLYKLMYNTTKLNATKKLCLNVYYIYIYIHMIY